MVKMIPFGKTTCDSRLFFLDNTWMRIRNKVRIFFPAEDPRQTQVCVTSYRYEIYVTICYFIIVCHSS